MRTWIYNRVKAILNWDDSQIISSGSGDSPAPPFAVVTMGVESAFPGMPVERKPSIIPFTVYIHVSPDQSMLDIDDAAVELATDLATEDGFKVGSVSVLNVRWTDTGQDGFDDHWGTNVRPVRFTMTVVH